MDGVNGPHSWQPDEQVPDEQGCVLVGAEWAGSSCPLTSGFLNVYHSR